MRPMEPNFTAFAGHRCLASGSLEAVVRAAKAYADRTERDSHAEPLLVFEDRTGNQVDFDLRGTPDEAVRRLEEHPLFARTAEPKRTGPGRPKLGVVAREVTLLPRHWAWLEAQRGGASAALRTLVEEATKRDQRPTLARKAREAAGKLMWTLAGNLPRFEEASRALWAKDDARLASQMRGWPKDVRTHVERLVAEASRLEVASD